MKKKFLALILAIILFLGASLACAESGVEPAAPAPEAAAEDPVVLRHTAVIQGQAVDYTTTTGYLTVDSSAGSCQMFYMAYTLDGAEDLSRRPITFAYNGGPGAASLYVQLGLLSPRRIAVDENGRTETFPVTLKDNEYSILDLTDLVFIDPVGTGYSRPAEGVDIKNFASYDSDLASVGEFIRLYTSRNDRWLSPKYLLGESYGTTRSVGLAGYLADTYEMDLNGIILISCLHNLTVLMDQENPPDLSYALYLPTYAAVAWYHQKLADEYQRMGLEDFLREVRSFAGGEYLSALFEGRTLDDAKKADIAARVAAFTGLSAEKVAGANLRVTYPDFCQSLLADQKLMIGRIDGRYTGPSTGNDMAENGTDPAAAAIDSIFAAAANHYIREELGYPSDLPYVSLSYDVNGYWEFPEVFGTGFTQESVLTNIMNRNRFLKVWVLCGYYDLATPFYAAEWELNHVFIHQDREANLRFTFYPSGHMFYMYEPALAQFRKEAEEWYR